jgi:hypothetical protein
MRELMLIVLRLSVLSKQLDGITVHPAGQSKLLSLVFVKADSQILVTFSIPLISSRELQ